MAQNRGKIVALGEQYTVETPVTTIGWGHYSNSSLPERYRKRLERRNFQEGVTLLGALKGWQQGEIAPKSVDHRRMICVSRPRINFSPRFVPALRGKKMKQGEWGDKTLHQFRKNRGDITRYQQIKGQYRDNITFYLDISDYFDDRGEQNSAAIVLDDLINRYPEHYQVQIVAAYRLFYMKQYQKTDKIIQKLRDRYDLQGDLLWIAGKVAAAAGDFQKALILFHKLILSGPDSHYRKSVEGLKLAALEMVNRLITHQSGSTAITIDSKLLHKLSGDLKIEIYSDSIIPFEVKLIDPEGNILDGCSERNQNRWFHMGGDRTGYLPKVFLGRSLKKGTYTIELKHPGRHKKGIPAPVTAYIEIVHNYNQKDEKHVLKRIEMADRRGKSGARMRFTVE